MDLPRILEVWLPPVLRVIVVLFATWLAAALAKRATKRAPDALRRQLAYAVPKAVWLLGLVVVLGSVGINIASLLAVMATLGIGAALIFTPVGQNLIAGFLAGIDDVVREGDVVEVGGKVGTVVRLGALSVGIRRPDGATVYMPNTKVVDDELINHSRMEGARIEVEIKLDGTPDRAAATRVMAETIEGLPFRIESQPTAVHFTEIGANAVHYRCFLWIEDRLQAPARESEMLTAIVDALDAAGVSVGETSNLSATEFVVEQGPRLVKPLEEVERL